MRVGYGDRLDIGDSGSSAIKVKNATLGRWDPFGFTET
jgi:hypothetical protein